MKNKLMGINPSKVKLPEYRVITEETARIDEELDEVVKFIGQHTSGPDDIFNRQEALDLLSLMSLNSNSEKFSPFDKAAELVYFMLDSMDDEYIVVFNKEEFVNEETC